jgi:hypothetical protein
MSDGGRGRASLGVKVWKSSQEWSVQRSDVRSIAWLDDLRAITADVTPHPNVVSARILPANVRSLVLHATLIADRKTRIAASNSEGTIRQAGSVRRSTADVREPDVLCGNISLGVTLGSSRAPTLQRSDVRTARQTESSDGCKNDETRNHLTRAR